MQRLSYESSQIYCKKCKKANSISNKFCSECGSPLLIPIQEIENNEKPVTKELLYHANEALYNRIVTDKEIKEKYYKKISEKVLLDRVDVLYGKGLLSEMMAPIDKGHKMIHEFKTTLRVYSMSLSLQGYTMRLCEELLSQKYLKINKISETEVRKNMEEHIKDCNELPDFNSSLEEIISDKEKLLSHFAYWLGFGKNRWSKYFLVEEDIIFYLVKFIVADALTSLTKDLRRFPGGKKMENKELVDNTTEDVIWGYNLKLSESLLSI